MRSRARIRGGKTTLAVALTLLTAGSVQAQETPDAWAAWRSHAIAVLEEYQEALQERGAFGPAGEILIGALHDSGLAVLEPILEAGASYVVVAVCDGDCSNLDLWAYDPDGGSLASDAAEDAQPVIFLRAPRTGLHHIEVVMEACSVEPCYWAAQVYREGLMPLALPDAAPPPLGGTQPAPESSPRTEVLTDSQVGAPPPPFPPPPASSPEATRPRERRRDPEARGRRGEPAPADAVDALDPSQVVWLHADVSGWPVTSTITGVRVDDGEICIEHTRSGQWPVSDGAEGNPWVIARVDGTWYAATYEWLRPGQVCKQLGASPPQSTVATEIGPHTKVSPLQGWRPHSGEVVYLLVSTPARLNGRTSNERSGIVRVVWP